MDAARYALYTHSKNRPGEQILLSGGFSSGEQENNRR
jgi:hypothetical protein